MAQSRTTVKKLVGFTAVPNAILRDPDLTCTAKLVYSVVLSYAWTTPKDWPSQEQVAEEVGCSVRSVYNAIQELKARGLLRDKRRGHGRTNVYEPLVRPVRPATSAGSRSAPDAELDRNEVPIPLSEEDRLREQRATLSASDPSDDLGAGLSEMVQGLKTQDLRRKRDHLIGTVASSVGMDLKNLTTSERSDLALTAKQLAEVGATDTDVEQFCQLWPEVYAGATLTHRALRQNWSGFISGGWYAKLDADAMRANGRRRR